MTTISDGHIKILHASDVQGPVTKEAKNYIIKQKPDLLVMDGPPTLFLGWKFSMQNLKDASDNLLEIINTIKCEVILDHHLLRDIKYKETFPEPYKSNEIELHFTRAKPIQYKQFDNQFVPGLSIIDVMMFNDKKKLREYLERYELI